jgi:sugar phosphate isomerase/epimerase
MRLSASNIAWAANEDPQVYDKLRAEGFAALEIAPTRWIAQNPYVPENIVSAASIADSIRAHWGYGISSMQSLWFGVKERLFGTEEEREFLLSYTRAAIDFAAAVGCPHIVFGSPKNRIIDHSDQLSIGEKFFVDCANHAKSKGVVVGIEANPSIYGTNYLTTTPEVVALVKKIDSSALKLNLDFGTMLINQENVEEVADWIPYISHVHISEPLLAPISPRPEHARLAEILKANAYRGWVSLEMKTSGLDHLFHSLEIVGQVFGAGR